MGSRVTLNRNNNDSKTKDDWSPEARKKALEARRAHKKAQPVEPTKHQDDVEKLGLKSFGR